MDYNLYIAFINHSLVIFKLMIFLCKVFIHFRGSTTGQCVFENGLILHRSQVGLYLGAEWLQGITELTASLQAIDVDLSAFACLAALTLITGN